MPERKKATLILEDGSRFEGYSFGHPAAAVGEVVFNTAMTGYPESLTDPSYNGQILVITYPLIGNYGVPSDEPENGIPRFYESDRIQVRALVVSDYSFEHSHWNARKSLDEWLREHGIPAIYGVDTRQITKIIREKGVMLGKIAVEGQPEPEGFADPNTENLVAASSCTEVQTYGSGRYRIVLVDCGCKYNIIRCLLRRDTTVVRVPWNHDFTGMDYDGVMISNGPGDPAMARETVDIVRRAMEHGKPIFGICMGNQILSMAAGASTYKLKYGHRSHNQPVVMCGSDKAYITSQNHGYAVDPSALSDEWAPFFTNLNDGTNEGIRHRSKPFFSVQFHPEATSGPVDTEYLFDVMIDEIKKQKSEQPA
ncbi:MAG: glutamine-hydrolyzing carbamoyl-phosphate synthase small subunit [Rikenellaceae bacterium]|nr:glutamine-hydrolyzing carbamoyl-phosphate synthase small subunit [Rikenellaceae bacterium]